MKIVSVVGARPNFVKLSRIHDSLSEHCEHIIIHTGQHYDYEMSDVFFRELKIPEPDINLEIRSDYPGAQIGEMIKRLEKEYGFGISSAGTKSRHPELVLVYGDTNSTFAGAFAASANHVPVAHVEAGLRSFDRRMPEERNRILTDHLSNILFAPTKTGVRNLKDERVAGKIVNSGDVSVEVVREAWKYSEKSSILKELGLHSKSFILFTMHRAESTDSPVKLKTMVRVFQDLGKKRRVDRQKKRNVRFSPSDEEVGNKENSISFDDMKIVFPIHPRTEKFFKAYGLYDELKKTTNVMITKPLGYIDFLRLVKESYKIVTDSGGLQKEAYLFSVPCITIRKSTEWVETLAGGWNILSTFKRTEILNNILECPTSSNRALMYKNKENRMVFGNGNTSEIIRKCIFSICGRR